MRSMAPHAPHPVPAPAPAFDRERWVTAVLSGSLYPLPRLTALVLARYAPGGHLATGGVQHTPRLRKLTGMSSDALRHALRELELAGLISRPPADTWTRKATARPITLTLPSAAAVERVPPSTGGPE